MTSSLTIDDDLLPLSSFAVGSFSALDLAKKRLLISQGEMSKLIADYERATSIELVSLVNDHYKEFLEVSRDVREIADRFIGLKDPTPQKYLLAKREVDSLVYKATKLQDETHSLTDARADIEFLDRTVSILQSIEAGILMDNSSLIDYHILADEYERLHANIEAMDAALAEGLRRGSNIVRETLPVLREEIARVRSEFATRLLKLLEFGGAVDEIYSCLLRIQAEQKLVQYLRSQYASRITYSGGEVSDFLARVRTDFLSPSAPFAVLAKALEPHVDVTKEVISAAVIHELTTKAPMSVFVPTGTSLNAFHRNYLAVRSFPRMSSEFLSKFKLSIYVGLHVKRVTDLLNPVLSDPRKVVETIQAELIQESVIIDGSCTARVVQFVLSIFAQLRDQKDDLSKTELMIESLIPSIRESFARFVPDSIAVPLFAIELKLFANARDRMTEKLVTDASAPIIQTLESVKQISALYRVASRGAPTRHSVYVDLAIKALPKVEESEPKAVAHRIVAKCVDAYITNVRELMEKEKNKGKPIESEKIQTQIRLDCAKLEEYLKVNFSTVPSLAQLSSFASSSQ